MGSGGMELKSGTRHGDKFWGDSDVKSSFGFKMMQKMGWGVGKGLGKEKKGRTKAIRVKKKNDNMGIGGDATTKDDQMKAATGVFEDILKRLAAVHDGTGGVKDDSDSDDSDDGVKYSTGASLKRYQARHALHSKFRKAKNVSSYNDAAKAELFGRRANDEEEEVQAETIYHKDGSETDKTSGVRVTTSETKIGDYFLQKMKERGVSEFAMGAASGFSLTKQEEVYNECNLFNTNRRQVGTKAGLGFATQDFSSFDFTKAYGYGQGFGKDTFVAKPDTMVGSGLSKGCTLDEDQDSGKVKKSKKDKKDKKSKKKDKKSKKKDKTSKKESKAEKSVSAEPVSKKSKKKKRKAKDDTDSESKPAKKSKKSKTSTDSKSSQSVSKKRKKSSESSEVSAPKSKKAKTITDLKSETKKSKKSKKTKKPVAESAATETESKSVKKSKKDKKSKKKAKKTVKTEQSKEAAQSKAEKTEKKKSKSKTDKAKPKKKKKDKKSKS